MPADKRHVCGGMIASFDEVFGCVVFESKFNSDSEEKEWELYKYYCLLSATQYSVLRTLDTDTIYAQASNDWRSSILQGPLMPWDRYRPEPKKKGIGLHIK
jgi:hypothetical protein